MQASLEPRLMRGVACTGVNSTDVPVLGFFFNHPRPSLRLGARWYRVIAPVDSVESDYYPPVRARGVPRPHQTVPVRCFWKPSP